ncbi:Transcriptional protein SWT1 [Papilio xuthus]|uniref:Transcriptional protein SWT1 n=1 Tax=Papilio xuthus TaxID=66420 RepID=A0A194PHR7_PAPXU|nr:Transcriptional protein SWT1 [Papilio xuthus]
MNIISDKFTDCWVLCKSRSNPGKQYYFNTRTRESSWIKPKSVQEKESCSDAAIKVESNRNEQKNRKEIDSKSSKRNYGNNTSQSSKSNNEVKQKQSHNSVSHGSRHNHLNMHKNKNRCSQSLKPAKNLAKNRLTKLRTQLTKEVEQEKKRNVSRNCESMNEKLSQTSKAETPTKSQRSELNSPNFNESNCTITSQTSSDSGSSSPSQFFAANKIISSMKAQLPEEYDNKDIQKDTYADIEQGICNKITGYPSNAHPSTPPQFSQADKLLSAIKTKLAYKLPIKDRTDNSYTASDRMQMLRRLSNETDDSRSGRHIEQMDVDEGVTLVYSRVDAHKPSSSCTPPNMLNTIQTNAVIVVDTNIFIHDLHCITHVLNSQIKGYREQPTLLVPWRVINELDKLKDNNNGNGVLCKRAKAAMDYLYKSLPVANRLKGQSLRDSNSHIFPCEVPDDEILNCCLQQSERGKSVVLLSNDKNLCNKAVINGIKTMTVPDLMSMLEGRPRPIPDPSLYASVKHYELTMYQLLANILENEMRARYKTLWEHVVCRPPPWDLQDVLFALLKHWIAVFHEVFPRIDTLLNDLKKSYTYIRNKDPKTLVEAEVCNFKELCVEVAKKCQIIPEYMELAKNTVDRLNDRQTRGQNNMSVMQAFETVWIIFSSYCAKLCRCLGIPHSIEDQIPGNEPVEGLISKYSMFRNHIISLNHTIQGVLNVDNSSNLLEGRISNLETELKSSLNLNASESGIIVRDELKMFCIKNRDLLQDATANLSTLIELLDVCKNNFH